MFVGFSPRHSSLVPLILNPQTGKISPQFHVIFDNWFTSVLSVGVDNAFEPSMWQTLFSHSCYHYMFDDHDAISLSDDWTDPGLQNVLVTEFRQPLQVQSHLEVPRILVQLGHIQRTPRN